MNSHVEISAPRRDDVPDEERLQTCLSQALQRVVVQSHHPSSSADGDSALGTSEAVLIAGASDKSRREALDRAPEVLIMAEAATKSNASIRFVRVSFVRGDNRELLAAFRRALVALVAEGQEERTEHSSSSDAATGFHKDLAEMNRSEQKLLFGYEGRAPSDCEPKTPNKSTPDAVKAFSTLFRIMTSGCRPLVLLLDNLQFADLASHRLIQEILEPDSNGLGVLIIGSVPELTAARSLADQWGSVDVIELRSHADVNVVAGEQVPWGAERIVAPAELHRDDELNALIDSMLANPSLDVNDESTLGQKNDSKTTSTIVSKKELTAVYRVTRLDESAGQNALPTSIAVKVLNDPMPSDEQRAAFFREYDVTKELCGHAGIRTATEKSFFNGLHAIHFEWVEGMVLQEMVGHAHAMSVVGEDGAPPGTTLLALAVSIALSRLHAAGYVHNAFSPDHVIVRKADAESVYSVALIGLSSASRIDPRDPSGVRRDVYDLGATLYQMYTGAPLRHDQDQPATQPVEEEDGNHPRPSKRGTKASSSTVWSMGPRFIRSMLTDLLHKDESTSTYKSVQQVIDDLYHYMHTLKSIQREGFHISTSSDRLNFPPDIFFGRSVELSIMKATFEMTATGAQKGPQSIFIAGESGSGKSFLLSEFERIVAGSGGHILRGKFDQLQQSRPLSTIASAIDIYLSSLIQSQDSSLPRLRASIIEGLGSDYYILTSLIPSIRDIMSKGQQQLQPTLLAGKNSVNRLTFAFSVLFRAMTKLSEKPLILAMDDLQWSTDPHFLQILRVLLTDNQNKSLLFVGCYRDNEVQEDHALTGMVANLEAQSHPIKRLNLGSIGAKSTNELVACAVQMPPSLTQTLGDAVYGKTLGSPLMIVHFLRSICHDGCLRYSLMSRAWEWDLDQIHSKELSEGILKLLKDRIRTLSPTSQQGLKVAACFGCEIDESTLQYFDVKEMNEVRSSLDDAVRFCLMQKVGTTYVFSHDQIQSAAYSSIPEDEKTSFHLMIGRMLRTSLGRMDPSLPAFELLLFLTVGQLNRGLPYVSDAQERTDVASLNLQAAEISMTMASISAAFSYIESGISMLNENKWTAQYDLSIRLYSAYAEVSLALGRYSDVRAALEQIMDHGRNFEDKKRGLIAMVDSLYAKNQSREAIDLGLDLLADVGEPFPSTINEVIVAQDVKETLAVLAEVSETDIAFLDEVADSNKRSAMQIIDRLLPIAFLFDKPLLVLLASRVVRLTLQESGGVCEASALGFAAFGTVEISLLGQVQSAYRHGKVALRLLERFESNRMLARVHGVVYFHINPWVEPLQASHDPLELACKSAMSAGDPDFAVLVRQTQMTCLLYSGEHVLKLIQLAESTTRICTEYGRTGLSNNSMIHQAALNLSLGSGHSEDPCVLTGGITDEVEIEKEAKETDNILLLQNMHLFHLWFLYLFGRHEEAARAAARYWVLEKTAPGRIFGLMKGFYNGLNSFALARTAGGDAPYAAAGREELRRMEELRKNNRWTFENKVQLLRAEKLSVEGDRDGAREAYDAAIKAAQESKFVHEEGISWERLGDFLLESGDGGQAGSCFERARQCYERWGAKAKADRLAGGKNSSSVYI